jgi:hypothetical protein
MSPGDNCFSDNTKVFIGFRVLYQTLPVATERGLLSRYFLRSGQIFLLQTPQKGSSNKAVAKVKRLAVQYWAVVYTISTGFGPIPVTSSSGYRF